MKSVVAWFQRNMPDTRLTLTIEDGSPWTIVELHRALLGPSKRVWKYAIWNETGAIHRMDQDGRVADDPVEVEELP